MLTIKPELRLCHPAAAVPCRSPPLALRWALAALTIAVLVAIIAVRVTSRERRRPGVVVTARPPEACLAVHLLEGGGSWDKFSGDDADPPKWSWPGHFDFTCGCPHFKARYACPPKPAPERLVWVPAAVKNGTCSYKTPEFIAANPLPPHASVFFAGNSHMRQVVESLLCMFPGAIASRRVFPPGENGSYDDSFSLGLQAQCRDCTNEEALARLDGVCEGLEHDDWNCECKDDLLEIVFSNGATLRYAFLYEELDGGKSLSTWVRRLRGGAEGPAGAGGLAAFDAVVVNGGNPPSMPVTTFLDEVGEALRASDALWAAALGSEVVRNSSRSSHPTGTTNTTTTTAETKAAAPTRPLAPPPPPKPQRGPQRPLLVWASTFWSMGFDRGDAELMGRLRDPDRPVLLLDAKAILGPRQGEKVLPTDSHFCMPGPVNDVALLVVHALWAGIGTA